MHRRVRHVILVLALAAAAAGAQPAAPKLYQNTVTCISGLLSRGVRLSLMSVLDLRVSGAGAAEAARRAASELEDGIRERLTGPLEGDERFTYLGARSAGEIGAKGDAEMMAACARAGAGYALLMSVEGYAAGKGEITETRARLMDLRVGKAVAEDILWTAASLDGARPLFVNGERVPAAAP
jgi:hypothetical protein